MRVMLSVFACLLMCACGSPVNNLMGVDNPATPAAEVEGTTLRTVYIATTRQRSDDDTILFTADRNPVGLGFAKAVVSIPPNRQPGAVVRPARLPPNPKREFVILDPVVFADDRSFANDLDLALSQRPPSQREILVFIHGYNTDLPASIMRMAQIVEDTGFSGIPIVFSWPSRGQLFQYGYDLNSALHARDELTQTVELVAATRTTGMNFVSHSMGNILAVEAMRQDQMTNNFNKSGKISSIVLAAPDIDVELFAKQLRAFPEGSRNFYILVSKDDQALALSRSLAGGVTRVGAADAERLSELGVTVIDLTKVDDQSDLNHSKFASATEFVQLIGGWLNETDAFREPDADSLADRLPENARIITANPR